MIEEPIVGPWSQENICTASIILQLNAVIFFWTSQSDRRTTFGSMVQGKHLQCYNSNTSKEHAYWTSQPDRRIIFRSLEQGKPSHCFHNTTYMCYSYWTSQLDRRTTFGSIEQEKHLRWYNNNTKSYWISQPDIRTTLGSLKQGKDLRHNNGNKRIEHWTFLLDSSAWKKYHFWVSGARSTVIDVNIGVLGRDKICLDMNL